MLGNALGRRAWQDSRWLCPDPGSLGRFKYGSCLHTTSIIAAASTEVDVTSVEVASTSIGAATAAMGAGGR